MAELTSKKRTALRDTTFAVPGERKFPIPDESHGRNALARSSGTKYEDQVKRAVYSKYPGLKPVTKEADPGDLAAFQAYQIESDAVNSDPPGQPPEWVGDQDGWEQARQCALNLQANGHLMADDILGFTLWYYLNGGHEVDEEMKRGHVDTMSPPDSIALTLMGLED